MVMVMAVVVVVVVVVVMIMVVARRQDGWCGGLFWYAPMIGIGLSSSFESHGSSSVNFAYGATTPVRQADTCLKFC